MYTVYAATTDPQLSWKQYFSCRIQCLILSSVLFHVMVYTAFVNLAWWVLTNHLFYANDRLVVVLFWIMYLGYMGRVIHVREIYRHRRQGAQAFVDQHYNSWIFLG